MGEDGIDGRDALLTEALEIGVFWSVERIVERTGLQAVDGDALETLNFLEPRRFGAEGGKVVAGAEAKGREVLVDLVRGEFGESEKAADFNFFTSADAIEFVDAPGFVWVEVSAIRVHGKGVGDDDDVGGTLIFKFRV